MGREKSFEETKLARNIEAMLRRTPPHLLNRHNRMQFNANDSTSLKHSVGSSSINPTDTRNENHDHSGFPPASSGGTCTGVAPQEGETRAYLYLPTLSPSTAKTSTSSSSLNKEGASSPHDNHSDHLRSLLGGNNLGGSNPGSGGHQLPHQLSSFYPVVPDTNGSSWNYFQLHHQQPAEYHYAQLARKEQPPLPSCWSLQNTGNISDSARTRPTSSSILGKRLAVSSHAQNFSRPPAPPTLDADGMAGKSGPRCMLQTDDLVSLVQSVGTPEFLANSERVMRLGSSLSEPHHAGSAHVPVTVSSGSVPEASLLLSLGNGNGDESWNGEQVSSYWDLSQLSAMATAMESMKKQRQETSQPLPVKTLGLDDQGCSPCDAVVHGSD